VRLDHISATVKLAPLKNTFLINISELES